MRKNLYYFLALSLFVIFSFPVLAQRNLFENSAEPLTPGYRDIIPEKYRTVLTSADQLQDFLWSLPDEKGLNRAQAPIMILPRPDGTPAAFRVWHSSIQEAGSKFPEIKTFAGQGIDDPYATLRMDFSPYTGFHAQVLSVNGSYYIDPFERGNLNHYISYFRTDVKNKSPFSCETEELEEDIAETAQKVMNVNAGPCRGTQLYTYRLAVACTGEYAIAVGGSTPAALHAAIVTTVNRVDGVYENELAVRLILIANNDLIEYMNPSTDPFNGNNNASTLIGESQSVITSTIGTANFDIGHTFSTGGGGLASLGVVCSSSNKARGITGRNVPVGDAFDIDYVAHEIGHQFGGSHSFNGSNGSCSGSRSSANAYEPGSGTTIQAYAGICSSDNLQPNSDPHFHSISYDQISNFIEAGGSSCKGVINTGNNIPQITAMDNNSANIPLNTPFTLNATATDADGDAITYCWEEWDLGPQGTWNSGANSTTAPLFKSRIPKTTGSRTFPDMAVIKAGYPANPSATMGGLKGEILPLVGRAIKFKLTVRDNRAGGGGITSGGSGCQAGFTTVFQVNAISGTGPFVVTVPNGGENYNGGSSYNVTWNVAGTNASPINCTNVRILLSTDGGNTYPTVLSANTANDGNELVAFPAIPTSQARVKIEGLGNIFFDISNSNFNINAAGVGFDFTTPAPASIACNGPSSSSITLGVISNGGFTGPVSLSAAGNPIGTTVSYSTNPVTPGNNTIVTLNNTQNLPSGTYNITITGVSGSITQTRVLTYVVQTGTGPVITTQPTDQAVCPAFNATFSVAANGGSGYQWQLSTDNGANFNNISGAVMSSYSVNGVMQSQNGNRYRVVVTGQCGSTVSNAAQLTVHPLPTVSLSASPYTRLYPGLKTTINAVTNPSTGVTLTWYKNLNVLPGVTGNSLEIDVTGIGNYMVQATDANGCINQSNVLTIADSSSSNLFVYPSPNNGRFNVAYYNAGGSTVQKVAVYDAHGALVFKKEYSVNQRYQLLDVNLWSAARGIYLVVVTDANNKKLGAGKVMVQ